MALGDYILCCKCSVKLIYDGDRGQREWWEERFGSEPKIECPDCKPQRTWVGLTPEQIDDIIANAIDPMDALIQTMDQLKENNT
jgi:hypothetical protein